MKGKGKGKGQGKGGREGEMRRGDEPPPRPGEEGGRPPRPQAEVEGILDVNGDGVVTAQEFADNAKSNAAKKGIAIPDAMANAKTAFTDMDKDRNGQLEASEWQSPEAQPGQSSQKGQSGQKGPGGGKGGKDTFVERPDQPRSSDGKFLLTSPVVEDMKELPQEFTGDGEAATPPLAWTGAPAATKSYALIMDHADKEGNMKWYWTQYDIPAGTTSDRVTGFEDWTPTILELAGLAPASPGEIDGISLAGLLRDGQTPKRSKPLLWAYYNAINDARVAMRHGPWKVLARLNSGKLPRYENLTPERLKLAQQAQLTDLEIYNLTSDPGETLNLAGRGLAEETELTTLLQQEYRRLADDSPAWTPADTP
jgi:hypothetical protein